MLADLTRKVYANLDAEWQRAAQEYERQTGSKLPCGPGCADCCKASDNETFFIHIPMRMAEAALLAETWGTLATPARDLVIDRLRNNYSATCLLLSPDNLCFMYEARPLWCRIFGLPGIMKCPKISNQEWGWEWRSRWGGAVYKARKRLASRDGFISLPTLIGRWIHDR